ncbi:alpha/beta hydrolase [Hymenobacter oligotrophus]|uniref:Alpha/beta hydrolase n=1 Tax=Hymenobacter oligotrophus TaxID=2319843 RepID=A0A3B7RVI4_9BACT|nr:alpha/beta hydrolase-fold protein [Hymenobacter oligotrophus]AYA38387.1 alpha/beta hydrolase [Hymenobacter oligotrophus]
MPYTYFRGYRRALQLAAVCLLLVAFRADNPRDPGRVVHLADFQSKHVKPRHVDVWLPDGYPQPGRKYAVLYMHDGQNLYHPATAYGGTAWEVDSTLAALGGQVRNTIVVGIWNTDLRFAEYAPAKPYQLLPAARREQLAQERPGQPLSDAYLRFIVEELKPYIDGQYRTDKRRNATFVAGSSMGGLISLYAAMEYPRVFGGAACVSTHWPLSLKDNTPAFTNAMLRYLAAKLPTGKRRPRLYFDYGTATLDARYEVHQLRIDSLLRAKGYDAQHWQTQKFAGAAHNEGSWKKRFATPALFLLGAQAQR